MNGPNRGEQVKGHCLYNGVAAEANMRLKEMRFVEGRLA
jgi:hypothetical protein